MLSLIAEHAWIFLTLYLDKMGWSNLHGITYNRDTFEWPLPLFCRFPGPDIVTDILAHWVRRTLFSQCVIMDTRQMNGDSLILTRMTVLVNNGGNARLAEAEETGRIVYKPWGRTLSLAYVARIRSG